MTTLSTHLFTERSTSSSDMGGVQYTLTEYHTEGTAISARPMLSQVQTLPINLVTGLVNASFSYPSQKQAVLDALSPFQVLSKLWVTEVLSRFYIRGAAPIVESVQPVLVGSWFGQQLNMLVRRSMPAILDAILVDMDPEAIHISEALLRQVDRYASRNGVNLFCEDVFKYDKWYTRLAETARNSQQMIFVWNGLEHFDPEAVKYLVQKFPEAQFVLQSTNMEADDHKFKCNDPHDMMEYLPPDYESRVQYLGEIQVPFGSRFMMMFGGKAS